MRKLLILLIACIGLAGCGSASHNGNSYTLTVNPAKSRFVGNAAAITPKVGDTLNASTGTYNPSATSYAYAWQHCTTASTSSCSAISGATSSAYVVQSSDVGDGIRIGVTATTPNGNVTAFSAMTQPAVTATRTTNCFSSPSACGYPDPVAGNVGMTQAQCSALPAFTPTAAGLTSSDYFNNGTQRLNLFNTSGSTVTISGFNMSGWAVQISSGTSPWVFNNDCMITASSVAGAGNPLIINQSTSVVSVTNSVISGDGCNFSALATTQCTQSTTVATDLSLGAGAQVTNDILVGAEENIGLGGGNGSNYSNDYIVMDAWDTGSHSENFDLGPTTTFSGVTLNHDTLLNASDQQSVFFAQQSSNVTCALSGISITNSLIGGGGTTLDLCNNSNAAGTSTRTITGNDFARCTGTPVTLDTPGAGGNHCTNTVPTISGTAQPLGTYGSEGQDSNGYWPHVGYFAQDADAWCAGSGTTWSGNFYDDNGATAACQ